MYVEQLLQLISDLSCDKGNQVFLHTYSCGQESVESLTDNRFWVDEFGDLHLDVTDN